MAAKSTVSVSTSEVQTSPQGGVTRISERALQSTVAAVVSDCLGIPPARITVNLHDDAGLLGLSVVTPVTWRHINKAAEGESTIFEVLDSVRGDIAENAGYLTDRKIGRINFRVVGICKHRSELKSGKRVIK